MIPRVNQILWPSLTNPQHVVGFGPGAPRAAPAARALDRGHFQSRQSRRDCAITNEWSLLYFIDVGRIHRYDRTHDVGSINPDPV